jgi:hypothetical protein
MIFSARQWKWQGQPYDVKYQQNEWTVRFYHVYITLAHVVTDLKATATRRLSAQVARFRPYIPNMFGKSGLATVYVPPSAPEEEMFFILVLLYSEFKRLEYQVHPSFSHCFHHSFRSRLYFLHYLGADIEGSCWKCFGEQPVVARVVNDPGDGATCLACKMG